IAKNSSAGRVPLNTRLEAVLMKAASIQPRRRSSTPRNSMAKTGAVTARVCWMRASTTTTYCDNGKARMVTRAPSRAQRGEAPPAPHASLPHLALPRAALHPQRPRRGGTLAVLLVLPPLDVHPLHAAHRHGVFRHQRVQLHVLG